MVKGSTKPMSAEDEAGIVDMLRRKETIQTIEERFHCHYNRVKQVAIRHGIDTSGRRPDLAGEELATVLMMMSDRSLRLIDITERTGHSRQLLQQTARKHGVNLTKGRYLLDAQAQLEVVRLIEQRVPMPEIAQRFECGPKTIADIAKRHGVQPNAKAFYLSKEQVDDAVQRYANGEGFQAIAKSLHVWPPNLRQVLVERGVSIQPNVTPPHIEDTIAEDYVHGALTIAAIERKHRVTSKVVQRIIQQRQLVRAVPATPTVRKPRRPNHDVWVERYGKEEADRRQKDLHRRQSEKSRGSKNHMYGKPSPQGSGNGWKGWYKGTFFRSIRELFFMVDVLEKEGLHWVNGERKEYRVAYVDPNGRQRTYAPDYVVEGKVMYEIKPLRLWDSPLVTAKRLAAEKRCAELGLTYQLVDPAIDGERLMAMWEAGDIVWMEKSEAKVRAYYEAA